MSNYKNASAEAQKLTFLMIKKRMKEKKMTQNQLAKILDVGVTTLIRYFRQETKMPLDIFFQICGILELHPYLVPKELDQNQMNRMYFN